MMKEDAAGGIVWIGLTATVMFILFFAFSMGYREAVLLKIEAVERGHAEWVVEPNGATTWQWKTEGGK